jgi:hypothetical protein
MMKHDGKEPEAFYKHTLAKASFIDLSDVAVDPVPLVKE